MTREDTETPCERAFRLGTEARLEGRLDDALDLFELSLRECPHGDRKLLGGINGMLSSVERKRGQFDSAERHSRTAISLLPHSQLASIGLFHVLWDQGKHREALNEVLRLISTRDSEHYRELLSHGFDDDLDLELRKLANKARDVLDSYV